VLRKNYRTETAACSLAVQEVIEYMANLGSRVDAIALKRSGRAVIKIIGPKK